MFLAVEPSLRADVPITSPAEREAALRGWVCAVLRADLLLGPVGDSTERQIDVEIFDGENTRRESLVFDADQHLSVDSGNQPVVAEDYRGRAFRAVQTLPLYGRTWNLWLSTRPEFDRTSEHTCPGSDWRARC